MSRSNPTRRRQYLVDTQVQGALLWRVALYWLCFLVSIALLQACWLVLTRQAATSGELFGLLWRQNGPALLASCMLLPVLMLDCARLTNRFAGPIVRVRRHLRQVAAGEASEPIKLRDGDFWQGLADDYNAAFARRQQEEEAPAAAETSAQAKPIVALPASAAGSTPAATH